MNASMALSDPRILIVDDDEDARDRLRLSLRDLNMGIEVVEDGIEALAMLLRGIKEGQAYPVIVLDCAMPYIDGFTTVRAIRCLETNRVLPHRTKIGMYTGYPKLLAPSTLLEDSDIDHFISKTDPESLVVMVKRMAMK